MILTNVNNLLGIIPIEVYVYEMVSYLVYLYFIYVVYCAYKELMSRPINDGIVEVIYDPRRGPIPSFENDDDHTDTRAV